jgi:RNA polymerase sigma-B factor
VHARRLEEHRLFHEHARNRGPRSRDALVERSLPLARSLARRLRRGAEPLVDLEQVAALALIRAIDSFDPDRGTAFSSYAVPSIVGALKRHFRDTGWTVRPPRAVQELALRVKRADGELAAATGSSPSVNQIAEQLGIHVEDVLEARMAYSGLYAESLDRPRRPGGDQDAGALLDTIGERDAEIRRAFESVTLDALIGTLEAREREIVLLYYREELTQSEIGERLGYSQMHISRLLRRSVEHLLVAAAADEPVLAG